MSALEKASRIRREKEILERLENVRRLIEMENTILIADGAERYARYCSVNSAGQKVGTFGDELLHELRNEIQLQLLSITALCYGDNPDLGEPSPMLEWKTRNDYNAEDRFREVWEDCLIWNA